MELWRAQAGAGKTESVVALIAETVRAQPRARIWVVLPTSRQRGLFRERLLAHLHSEKLPALNVELFNFYSLNRRLLNLLQVPVRSLRGGARLAVLRRVALPPPLETYAPVAGLPGFARAIGDLIAELKSARIDPDSFLAACQTPRDRDLAHVYQAYQNLLRAHGLVDTEGEAWLALDALDAAPAWDAKLALLVVDGFDQFTVVQAKMVQALSLRARRSVVTLTTVDRREDGVGRRFTAAQEQLSAGAGASLPPLPHPQPCVRHLLEHAFDPGAPPVSMPADAARTLALIEAHSPSAEAAEVVRHIKRRLVLEGAAPDDVMVVVRDWVRYQPALTSAAREFGVPISLQAGAPLTRHPLCAAIEAILALPLTNFAFGAVIDALRSPYIAVEGLPRELIAKVERAARMFNLQVGREQWEQALSSATQPAEDHAGREIPPVLTDQECAAAVEALNRLFDALPVPDARLSMWNFVALVEELIGADPHHPTDPDAKLLFTLDIARCVRNSDLAGDDFAALRAVKEALRELLLTEDLLATLTDAGGRAIPYIDCLADFRAALETADTSVSPDRSGRVLVTTATDARGSAHQHVYILGLSEGIFPAPLEKDPFFLDTERTALTRDGQRLLRSAAERADDDSLFFELLAQARESLVLTRPTMNGGQAWPASSLWNAVTDLLTRDDLSAIRLRILPGRPPSPERSASLPELAASLRQVSSHLGSFLAAHDPLRAAHIVHAQAVERSRYTFAQDDAPGDHAVHIGDFRAPEHRPLAGRLADPGYLWSASALNVLATCAYRTFAEKLIGLEELEDPEEGADARLQGDLLHLILEATYKKFRSRSRPISPDQLDFALLQMQEAAEDVFAHAIRERRLVPGAIWPQQSQVLRRSLEEMIRRDFSNASPVTEAFGDGVRWTLATEVTFDLDSGTPVTLTGAGGSFHLTGKIDRVDCIDTGDALRLVVIDYKLGSSSVTPADVERGFASQIVLYATALRQLLELPNSPKRETYFGGSPAKPLEFPGGLFWSLRSGKPLHVLKDADGDRLSARVIDLLSERIAAVRNGDFRPVPAHKSGDKCSLYCSFADLCRLCELA